VGVLRGSVSVPLRKTVSITLSLYVNEELSKITSASIIFIGDTPIIITRVAHRPHFHIADTQYIKL